MTIRYIYWMGAWGRIDTANLAIDVRGVAKSFGDVHALVDVDLQVESGTILALLGPNGAGKTTLVRILTTLLPPGSGRVTIGGHDVVANPNTVRALIGLAGQSATVDDNLTGRENLEMVGMLYHLGRGKARSRAADLLRDFDLVDAATRPVKTYSGGMRRRLDLAASLVGDPKILFLDEPTTGLDPKSRLSMWATIQELAAEGVTVLLTTQYLDEADFLADRIAVIDRGTIIALGTPDELKSRLGGDVIEIRTLDRSSTLLAAEAVSALASAEVITDEESGSIKLPVSNGPSALAAVVRELDAAGIAIAELEFRRPSLDEVFLSLTGHSTPASATTEEKQEVR